MHSLLANAYSWGSALLSLSKRNHRLLAIVYSLAHASYELAALLVKDIAP